MTTVNYAQGNTTIYDAETNAVMNAANNGGIISGGSVSKGSGDWDIDVTAGEALVDGIGQVPINAGTVTITDSSALASGESRITLLTVQTDGTLNSVDGSAATNPDSPDIPADEVLLGFVVVADTDSTLADSDINDLPAMRHRSDNEALFWGAI